MADTSNFNFSNMGKSLGWRERERREASEGKLKTQLDGGWCSKKKTKN